MPIAAAIIPIPPHNSKYLRKMIRPPLRLSFLRCFDPYWLTTPTRQNRARWGPRLRSKEQAKNLPEDELFDYERHSDGKDESCDDGYESDCELHMSFSFDSEVIRNPAT
jgi:hypothetical protein